MPNIFKKDDYAPMKEWSKDNIMTSIANEESAVLYFYTPMCGTCQVAGRMIGIVEHMFTSIAFGKMDLNYLPGIAEQFSIESVPCLLIMKEGKVMEKVYAFKSVPYLHALINDYFK